MRAINHAMTGAIIGLTVAAPAVAVPAALVSHFVLDAVPHFGERVDSWISPLFKVLLWLDLILCPGLVLILFLLKPNHWLLAIVCAFLAACIDLVMAPRYFKVLRGGKRTMPNSALGRFHLWVQWFQRPPGAIVEIAWAVACIFTLVRLT